MVFVMHQQLQVINTTFCPHRDGILCYIYKDRQILSWDRDASLIRPISIPGRLTWTQKSSPAVPKWTLECLTTFDDLKEYAVGLFYVQTLNSLLLCEQPPPGEKVGSSAIRSHTLNHYHFDCTLGKKWCSWRRFKASTANWHLSLLACTASSRGKTTRQEGIIMPGRTVKWLWSKLCTGSPAKSDRFNTNDFRQKRRTLQWRESQENWSWSKASLLDTEVYSKAFYYFIFLHFSHCIPAPIPTDYKRNISLACFCIL